ncbi:hypothetical protein [Corallincola holothuriorum]|nr:hypothetical protein [Corallincola holothuriorum]
MMRISHFVQIATVMMLLLAGTASAAIIGVGEGGRIIDAPAVIDDDSVFCSAFSEQGECEMLGFDERQGVGLANNLSVDQGVLASGDIDSHMIFLNTMGRVSAKLTVDWYFDGKIIGVMSDRNGKLEALASAILGAEGTRYPDWFKLRGLENNDWYKVDGNKLTFHSYVKEPGDWIRVVTRAMIPDTSAIFLSFCLLALLGWRQCLADTNDL